MNIFLFFLLLEADVLSATFAMRGTTGKRLENMCVLYIIRSVILPFLQTKKLGVEETLRDQAVQITY